MSTFQPTSASRDHAGTEPAATTARASWGEMGIPFGIAAASFLALMLVASRYGYFRDELYYLACARHLAWGYVDQPPFIALVTWAITHTLGTALWALRLVPALANAAAIVFAALLARTLGGGRYAAALASLTVAVAGIFIVLGHLLTMNVFGPLFWMACAWALIRVLQTGDQRYWLLFGLFAGLGLENKYSIALFGATVVLGLILTPARRAFLRPWIWAGGAVALLLFAPNLVWNIHHHWPFLQLMHNIHASGRDIHPGPLGFWWAQIFMLSPITLLVWPLGLYFFFKMPEGRPYRALGWATLAVPVLVMLLAGKDYYTAPVYPILFAAGAVAWERFATRRAWLKPTLAAVLLLATAPLLPMLLPVLSIPTYLRYQHAIGLAPPATEKSHLRSPLPQYYSDDLGWENLTAVVAQAWQRLPPEQRARTAIFGQNYGEAGAIDFFGSRYGLPNAISGHQNYFLWGPRSYTGESAIIIGDHRERLEQLFAHVEFVGNFGVPYGLEQGSVWLCTQPRGWNLQSGWPRLKNWD